MKKLMRKILSVGISAAFIAGAVPAFASGSPANTFKTEVYLGDDVVDTVFVGETITAKVTLDSFANIKGYDLILKYDSSAIQLFNGEAVITSNGAFATCPAVTLNNDLKLQNVAKNNIYPNEGYLHYAAAQKNEKVVADDSQFAAISFRVIGAGDASLVPAGSADYDVFFELAGYDMAEANPSGVEFKGASSTLSLNRDIAAVTAYAKPTDAQNVAWPSAERNYNAAWIAPTTGCRGYTVNLYKNGGVSPVATDDTDSLTYDFSAAITANGPGNYVFGVIAKGAANNADEVKSASKEVTQIPMASTNAVYNDTTDTLTWDSVAHANGYNISLENTKTSDVEEHNGVSGTSYSGLIGDNVGDYEITVTATTDDINYAPNVESPIVYSTRSTISGKLRFAELTARQSKKIYSAFLPTVTLTDVTDDTVNYSGKAYYQTEEDSSVTIRFAVKKVPVGEYYVTVSGTSLVPRTMKNTANKKLYVAVTETSSIIISKGDGIGTYMGNIDQSGGISLDDLSDFLDSYAVTEQSDPNYSAECNFYDDGEGNEWSINGELALIIAAYGKSATFYYKGAGVGGAFDDYNNLLAVTE